MKLRKASLFGFISFLVCPNLFSQSIKSLQTVSKPLVLKSQGSFFVGGKIENQTFEQLGSFGPAGHITVNQMYVHYMIPKKPKALSVVMIHGMTLTGKTWETTPDGRIGWEEYFVRKGYGVYIPDQVGRGRSGFNQSIFNDARAGKSEASKMPPMWRFSDEASIPNFRIGTTEGKPNSDGRFPFEALPELSKQAVPDVSMAVPNPNPTYKALADLSTDLGKTVLISHSQSGTYPIEAALIKPDGIAAMIFVEPGSCPVGLKLDKLAKLSQIPTLVVFGDYLTQPTGVPHSWQTAYDGCKKYIEEVNAAGGKAEMLFLPEKGIKGNSHMLMQDKNNLEIADILIDWLKEL